MSKVTVYQYSKTKGKLIWTGTIKMTNEKWKLHRKNTEDYIYTTTKIDL